MSLPPKEATLSRTAFFCHIFFPNSYITFLRSGFFLDFFHFFLHIFRYIPYDRRFTKQAFDFYMQQTEMGKTAFFLSASIKAELYFWHDLFQMNPYAPPILAPTVYQYNELVFHFHHLAVFVPIRYK